jgi:AraC-like DNA-binding protein
VLSNAAVANDRALVTNSIPPRFLRYLRGRGVDVEPFIRRFGFPEDVESRQDVRTRLDVLIAFSEECEAVLKDPMVGLHVAESLGVGGYGLLEFVARSSPTMRHAVQQMVRYLALVEDAVSPRVAEVRGDAVLEFGVPRQAQGLGRQLNEYILCVMLRQGRLMMQADWPLKSVWFAHDAPSDVTGLVAFLGTAKIEFGARSNGMRYDATLMDLVMPAADAALHAFLEEQARGKLLDQPGDSVVKRVRDTLQQGMAGGNIQIERVATALHCSGRTLQRRLTDEGTSFQAVLDDVRHEQALVLLEGSKRSVAEVAFMLGYSDLGPFVRAFKRWTGRTPAEHRARA